MFKKICLSPALAPGFALLLVGACAVAPSLAGPTRKAAKPAPTLDECRKCHMRYVAAVARKNHFPDPVDGGKLTPVRGIVVAPKKPNHSPAKP